MADSRGGDILLFSCNFQQKLRLAHPSCVGVPPGKCWANAGSQALVLFVVHQNTFKDFYDVNVIHFY